MHLCTALSGGTSYNPSKKRNSSFFFSLKWPLAFLGLLSEDHPDVLARNDWRRSCVAWIFGYFPMNSMEFFLKISLIATSVPQFHPFPFAAVFKNFICWPLGLWDTMLSSEHSVVEHFGKSRVFLLKKNTAFFPDLDTTRLIAGLWGRCWGTHHLVSSFEAHFED